jgi:hypothetical protein
LWIVEPPFIAADRSTVDDPLLPVELAGTGRSNNSGKTTMNGQAQRHNAGRE